MKHHAKPSASRTRVQARPLHRYLYGAIAILSVVALVAGVGSQALLGIGTALRDALLPLWPAPGPRQPTSDVAPPPPEVDVQPGEAPETRRGESSFTPAEEGIAPSGEGMEAAQPPQDTEPLVAPPANSDPPDPFTTPPMVIDPNTGSAPEPED